MSVKVQESKTSGAIELQTENQNQNQNEGLLNENRELQELVSKLKSDLDINQSKSLSESELLAERQKLESELDFVRKEQEDLLVLLTDQDSKLRHYKRRLKELGQTVSTCNDVSIYCFLN